MTRDQKIKFNKMYNTLKKIAHGYKDTDAMKGSQSYGLSYQEELEMAYENIQGEAERTINDIRPIK